MDRDRWRVNATGGGKTGLPSTSVAMRHLLAPVQRLCRCVPKIVPWTAHEPWAQPPSHTARQSQVRRVLGKWFWSSDHRKNCAGSSAGFTSLAMWNLQPRHAVAPAGSYRMLTTCA